MSLPITSFYVGVLALLFLALSFNVSLGRIKGQVSLGDGGDKGLMRRIRAQANAAEYLPLALIILALVEGSTAPPWVAHLFGSALVVGRLFHAYALTKRGAPLAFRQIGVLLTWGVLFFGGLGLIGHSLTVSGVTPQ
ncbi:MAG: MAPEG family protein [Pseudomonadota bacterium]